VAEVSRQQDAIVDCGGGVVLDAENVSHLKKTGTVFYLSATPEAIYNRIKEQTHRPLLHTPDPLNRIRALLDKRRAFYEQADYTIDTNDDDWSRICDEIVGIVTEKTK
jgi:shikimate kinase